MNLTIKLVRHLRDDKPKSLRPKQIDKVSASAEEPDADLILSHPHPIELGRDHHRLVLVQSLGRVENVVKREIPRSPACLSSWRIRTRRRVRRGVQLTTIGTGRLGRSLIVLEVICESVRVGAFHLDRIGPFCTGLAGV